jgi:hypothetical protein
VTSNIVNVHIYLVFIERLYSRVLFYSLPSSIKKLCPNTSNPTLYETFIKFVPCIVNNLEFEWCTETPFTQLDGIFPFL